MSNVASSCGGGAVNVSEPPLTSSTTSNADLLLDFGPEVNTGHVVAVDAASSHTNGSVCIDAGLKHLGNSESTGSQSSVIGFGQITTESPQITEGEVADFRPGLYAVGEGSESLGECDGRPLGFVPSSMVTSDPVYREETVGVLSSLNLHSEEESNDSTIYLNEQHCPQIMKFMKAQRSEGRFCDVVIHTHPGQGHEIWAHRSVLCANSPYFESILAATQFSPGPDQLTIPSHDEMVLEMLLDYMYTGHLNVSTTNVDKLLRLSCQLSMEDVKQCCGIHLAKHVDITNWTYIQSLAEEYAMLELNRSVMNFVRQNFESIAQRTEVLSLPHSSIKCLLKECNPEYLTDNEICRLKLIFHWVNLCLSEREEHYTEMLCMLQSSLLTFNGVQKLLRESCLEDSELSKHPATLHFLQKLLQQDQVSETNALIVTYPEQKSVQYAVSSSVATFTENEIETESRSEDEDPISEDCNEGIVLLASDSVKEPSQSIPEQIHPDISTGVNGCHASRESERTEVPPFGIPVKSNKSKRKSTNPRRITVKKAKPAQETLASDLTNRLPRTRTSKRSIKSVDRVLPAVTRGKVNSRKVTKLTSRVLASRTLRPKKIKLEPEEKQNKESRRHLQSAVSQTSTDVPKKSPKPREFDSGRGIISDFHEGDIGESLLKRTRTKKAQKEADMLRCTKCSRLFLTPNALKHHMKGHGSDVPLLCEVCGFTTVHFASMNVHKRQHNGKKFKCTYEGCDFQSIRRSRLDDHLNGHQGIKNHMCTVCGKAFTARKHLHRHEKIHSDVKFQSCEHCDYSSSRRDKLRNHMKSHHPEVAIKGGWLTQEEADILAQSQKRKREKKKKETEPVTLKKEPVQQQHSQPQQLQQTLPHSLIISPAADALSGQFQLVPSGPSVIQMGDVTVDGAPSPAIPRPAPGVLVGPHGDLGVGGPLQPALPAGDHSSPAPQPMHPAPAITAQLAQPVVPSHLAGTLVSGNISEEMIQYLATMSDQVQMQSDASIGWTYHITSI